MKLRARSWTQNLTSRTSCQKIRFDTCVRSWFSPRVTFSPWLRSGANSRTRRKSNPRTSIEMYYSSNFVIIFHFTHRVFVNLIWFLITLAIFKRASRVLFCFWGYVCYLYYVLHLPFWSIFSKPELNHFYTTLSSKW